MDVTAIRSLLTDDEDVAALVGNRVFFDAAPDGADRPHVVLTFTGASRLRAGNQTESTGPVLMEAAAVASAYSAARDLADKMHRALSDASTADVDDIEVEDEYDAPNIDASPDIFAIVQTYSLYRVS
jgi:hypothetical protein